MPLYLRPNVQIEPLVNQWTAHLYLLNPATAAMFIRNYHIPVMQSFVQMPMAHISALKNPDMVGGAFIDLPVTSVNDVKELISKTSTNCRGLIELAEAVVQCHTLLEEHAKGGPLADLYEKIPLVLRPYVELVYDIRHTADIRFFENLLYASECASLLKRSIALSFISSDQRPFVFSTPRIQNKDILQFDYDFNDPRIDRLSRLRHEPMEEEDIMNYFEVPEDKQELLKKFLSTEPPIKPAKYTGNGIRVRYFGHACLLIETNNVCILCDPLVSYSYATDLERFTIMDLPHKIDYVLLTHAHHDHVSIEFLLQLRPYIGTVIVPRSGTNRIMDPSLKSCLRNIGFKNVMEMEELDSFELNGVSVTAIPFMGEHCDLAIQSKAAYVIRSGDSSVMVAADSSCLNPALFSAVQPHVGNIDHLFIGLESTGSPLSWAYGPLFPKKPPHQIDVTRRSNGSNSKTLLEMQQIFSVGNVYLYAMGLEPWLNYIMALQHKHEEGSEQEIGHVIDKSRSGRFNAKKLFAKEELILN